jgi:hypothetical protein
MRAEPEARKRPPQAARNPRTASGAGKFMLLAMLAVHIVYSSYQEYYAEYSVLQS